MQGMLDEANRALGPAAMCAKHLDAATEVKTLARSHLNGGTLFSPSVL
jgi:hypothetical protein